MKGPSMRKIAQLANVSVATVSYALNNKPGISPETRRRILQIMEEEQYTPCAGSSAAAHMPMYLYLIIDDQSSFANVFYSAILDTIAMISSERDYHVVLCNCCGSFQQTTAAAAIRRGTAAGVIFFHDIEEETLLFLRSRAIPFVIIDSHRSTGNACRIGADYELAVRTATQHLIDLGHRNIAFIGQKNIPDFYIAAFGGFCKALSDAGLSMQPQWIKDYACDFDTAYRCMEDLFRTQALPTAVVCSTDQFALAAMHCAQDHKLSIPGDISFVGVDDLPVSQIYHPPLTTIHIDLAELAEKAIDCLHRQICGTAADCVHTIRSDKLIIRRSTGAAQKK